MVTGQQDILPIVPFQVIECENNPHVLVVSQLSSSGLAAELFQDSTFQLSHLY